MARINRVSSESMDVKVEMINRLKEIAPGVFEEGKIDFNKLKSLLGPSVDSREEKYSFTWAGRKDALLSLQSTSKGTLVPDQKESVNFDTTENVFIEGDNLEVLKLLQKSYFGKVKMIYIDPPYNTGRDFIYKDDFRSGIKSYLQQTGQANGDCIKLTTNPETNGRFHSDWLTMMYPRLFLARNLLKDDGLIFVSIDDNEIQNLRMIMNEVFGEENFLGAACRVAKKTNNKGDFYAPNFDYILTYSKDKEAVVEFGEDPNEESYSEIETSGPRKGEKYQLIRLYMSNIKNQNPDQRYFIDCPDGSKIIPPGKTFPPSRPEYGDGIWRWTKSTFEKNKDRIVIKQVKSSNLLDENGKSAKWNVFTKTFLKDVIESSSIKPHSLIENHINEIGTEELGELKIPFDFPKPSTLIKYLMKISKVDSNDIILDFFAGSGTTAQAVLNFNKQDGGNRKFIIIQFPELTDSKSEAYRAGFKTISDITKERIRRIIDKLEKESTQQKLGNPATLDLGFKVFRLSKSNFKIWENFEGNDSSELKKQLSLFKNALISGAKDTDVIYECAIKEGFNLNTKIEKVPCKGQTVYLASDDFSKFYICLDEKIKSNLVDELKLTKETQLFCLDEALSDSQKMNLSLQCRLKTI